MICFSSITGFLLKLTSFCTVSSVFFCPWCKAVGGEGGRDCTSLSYGPPQSLTHTTPLLFPNTILPPPPISQGFCNPLMVATLHPPVAGMGHPHPAIPLALDHEVSWPSSLEQRATMLVKHTNPRPSPTPTPTPTPPASAAFPPPPSGCRRLQGMGCMWLSLAWCASACLGPCMRHPPHPPLLLTTRGEL